MVKKNLDLKGDVNSIEITAKTPKELLKMLEEVVSPENFTQNSEFLEIRLTGTNLSPAAKEAFISRPA